MEGVLNDDRFPTYPCILSNTTDFLRQSQCPTRHGFTQTPCGSRYPERQKSGYVEWSNGSLGRETDR